MGQGLDRQELGKSTLMSILFFLQVREFFVLHRMVGRTWRGVLTPGYFEPCNLPSERSNEELKSKGRIERERQWGIEVKGSSVL